VNEALGHDAEGGELEKPTSALPRQAPEEKQRSHQYLSVFIGSRGFLTAANIGRCTRRINRSAMLPKEANWRKGDQRIGPGKHLKKYKDRINSSLKVKDLLSENGLQR
jgi:hypothetical protein